MTTVTVLPGPERRRRWTTAEKLRIVEESLAGEASVAEVARRHDVHPNLLHLWRRQARTRVLLIAPEDGSRFIPVAVGPAGGTPAVTLREADRELVFSPRLVFPFAGTGRASPSA